MIRLALMVVGMGVNLALLPAGAITLILLKLKSTIEDAKKRPPTKRE